MLPYFFFVAGHINYDRYGLYYLCTIEAMSKLCQEQFFKGEHVMRHVPGLWDGIWSHMFIDTGMTNEALLCDTKTCNIQSVIFSLHIRSRLKRTF